MARTNNRALHLSLSAPHIESALRQMGEDARRKRALVARVKEAVLDVLRRDVALPLSNDDIVRLSLGKDGAGAPIPHDVLALARVARWCVAIEESPRWDAGLERCLLASMYQSALPLAEIGEKFVAGRKPGTAGPIRKAIARLLKKNPAAKNEELWQALAKNPPRGWVFRDSPRLGRYAEGPRAKDSLGFRRFCNIAAEQRRALKKR